MNNLDSIAAIYNAATKVIWLRDTQRPWEEEGAYFHACGPLFGGWGHWRTYIQSLLLGEEMVKKLLSHLKQS